ncbi:hypothetical protein B0H16DRAFT_1534143, partial [Mycena metata]
MPALPDGSLSILASPLPPVTAAKIMLVVVGLLSFNLDKVFGEVSNAGLLGLLTPEDVQTVVSTYQMLRVEVGKVQTETLRNSKSWCTGLFSVFAGGSVSLLCYIKDVKDFARHLQLLQEDHRNKTNSLPLSFATGVSQARSTSTARFR